MKSQIEFMEGFGYDQFGNINLVEIWHPINGEWMHFAQITKSGERQYYTNREIVRIEKVDSRGLVFPSNQELKE